jgi:hypothetical protein
MTRSLKHQVVIVGGGFAGLRAAQMLRNAPVQITLIDRRNFHLFQPLLYAVSRPRQHGGDRSIRGSCADWPMEIARVPGLASVAVHSCVLPGRIPEPHAGHGPVGVELFHPQSFGSPDHEDRTRTRDASGICEAVELASAPIRRLERAHIPSLSQIRPCDSTCLTRSPIRKAMCFR